jgi:hypothetical protein
MRAVSSARGGHAAATSGAGPEFLTLRVSSNVLAGGTGCADWEAGLALSAFVNQNKEAFAGRRCLELGCGAGLVAIALCRAGAAQV